MITNKKPTGRAMSIPKGLLVSGAAGLGITIVGSWIIAYLISKEFIEETNIGYVVMVLLIITSLACSLLAWKQIKHRKLFTCISAGVVYYVVLLSLTALFFGGQYTAVLETALLVLCGSFLAVIITSGPKKRKKYGKIKNAYR